MISLGDIKVSEMYLGSSPVAEAYLGDEKVYPEESPEPPTPTYRFEFVPESLNVPSSQGTVSCRIDLDGVDFNGWGAPISGAWYRTTSSSSTPSNVILYIECDENAGSTDRTATLKAMGRIRETSEPITATFTLTQAGKEQMSVQELIDNGYAEVKQDGTRKLPGSETSWNVIQIHQSCPIALENITDFDDYLTSATTFVWREELPDGWIPSDLVAKYDGVELVRPIMPEMFPCVDLSGVEELTLSFNGGGNQYTHSSIVSERYDEEHDYYSGVTFKTPKHLTVTVRDNYGSVAQTNFSMLDTTTGITINCQIFSCHDVVGMFEHDVNLESLVINGSFRWDAWRTCHLAFDQCHKLESIPYVIGWGRDSAYNTIYPKNDGARGSADCAGLFNASGLTSIGPVLNMSRISLSGCVTEETWWDDQQQQMVTSSITQNPLSYGGRDLYNCPELTDVRIINLSNNDWNFADHSTKTYIPKMDTASIEYLLNNVEDCTSDPHTVTFSTLHQGGISQSAIDNAKAKGWSVAWQS